MESASRFQDEAPAMLREAKEDTEDLKTRVSAIQRLTGTQNHRSRCKFGVANRICSKARREKARTT